MIATLRPLTYDDLVQMPDDGQRREALGGELIVYPAPRRDHQEVVANLDWLVQQFLRASGLGRVYTHPVDVYLGRHDIVQPDLVVIRDSRLSIYRPEGIVTEPPDIVVEIQSPRTRGIDLVRKMALYARSGVPEYWIADPEQRTCSSTSGVVRSISRWSRMLKVGSPRQRFRDCASTPRTFFPDSIERAEQSD